MQFRKDINGLRAIAVIAVVLFHFNASWMPGGFAGVDVFFVISGFLMTGIIFKGIERENFSILKFYVARANRIIPALGVLCLVLFIFGWFYLTPLDYRVLGKHIASSMGFISNIIYWTESGYFEAASHEKWLLHTWSLSAEWQFYIIYPIILVAMRKLMSLNAMKTTILVATILGFIFCVITTYQWPNAAYYLLPTRAWEMMIGGVAYLYPLSLTQSKKKLVEWFGLGLILISYIFVSKENLWPGYLALLPVMGTYLLIQAQRNNSVLTGNVIFQYVGKWSYSIYLWHWPLVVAIYYFSLSDYFIYLGILLSIILGFLSHKYIEQIKFKNDFIKPSQYLQCKPFIFVLIIGLVGSCTFISNGINHPIRAFSTSEEVKYTSYYHRDNYYKYIPEAYSLQCNFLDSKTHKVKDKGIADECVTNGNGGIFIWGDSHGQALSYGIREVFTDVNINQVTTASCRPLIKEDIKTIGDIKASCDISNKRAKEAIIKIKPDVILLVQRAEHNENEFREILDYIKSNNLETKLVLVGPVPQWQPSLPAVIAKRYFDSSLKSINDHSFVDELFVINEKLHKKYDSSDIEYISLIDNLCENNYCLAKVDDNNTPLVWDYGHLSLEGSKYIASEIIKGKLTPFLHKK
ncbi:acyltransferase family protein [Pseudoalteromonas byunsanensis]|uniref:Acyltransferase n=1 Tax=Pseudoalteromonas byunsanensis TaxID=327939 RepID=A0A1S1N5T2_9GAMM|nr:acyltransferase family protein [Pseudoalteromonas byunsanensis]OHU93999.1 acyltransferase [Pseudoalteromonas byunsanensis]